MSRRNLRKKRCRHETAAADDDAIVAGLLTYIRNSWGNEASEVTVEEVKRMRKVAGERKEPWTIEELGKTFPSKKTESKEKADVPAAEKTGSDAGK